MHNKHAFSFDDDLSIDLTPLIDVIFMLLVFFIMTTTFSKPVLEIMLPQAQNTDAGKKQEEIVISVDAEGKFFYNSEEVDLNFISETIDKNPDATLNLYIDKDTPFKSFVHIVDKAKAREGGKFVISTEAL